MKLHQKGCSVVPYSVVKRKRACATAPSYVRRGLDEATLVSEYELAKRNKHVLNGATMVP